MEFPDYAATRSFLEGAEASCKRAGIYPDMSFGRTYVNLTLLADGVAPSGIPGEAVGDALHQLAAELDALVSPILPQAGLTPAAGV